MDYLRSLHCKTEPFASPAGAEIIFGKTVRASIAKLSRIIHHGGGLQLLTGEEGTGKTTLLHELAQKFRAENDSVVLLLSNPRFRDLRQFLITVAGIFRTIKAPSGFDDDTFQMGFNNFFFKLCRQENKTVLLLIDNGHNLPDFCFQALNSFYEHHPDCRRYLQTVICGEPSLRKKISKNKALNNRVVSETTPDHFRFQEIRKLIHIHLEHAAADPGSPPSLFSLAAQWHIYLLTQGHPKKTIDLCHFIVLSLIIENRKKADWFMVLRTAKRLFPERAKKLQIIRATSFSTLIALALVFGFWSEQISIWSLSSPGYQRQVLVPGKAQPPEAQEAGPPIPLRKSLPPENPPKTVSPESAVIKETLPPITPEKEPAPEVVPTAKSAAAGNQSEDKISTPEIPGYGAAEIMDKETESKFKQIPDTETIAVSALGQRQEEKPPAAAASASRMNQESDQQQLADAATDLRDKQVEPPAFLGDIITAPGENFGDMVRRIYGPWSFNPENVKTVMAANPQMKNPERLNVGDTIRFPSIPVALTPEAEEMWWIRITTFDNIQSAYRFLRQYRKTATPLLIIPSRDDRGRVQMNILREEYFRDKESAQTAINTLPPAFKDQAEALHGLNPATFYYRFKQDDE